MLPVNIDRSQIAGSMKTFTAFSPAIEVQSDQKLDKLLADLTPTTSWVDRQIAAQILGYLDSPEALAGLLNALPADPFWMVRCSIIQALERIGDPGAIPTLQEVAKNDSFQIVRSFAAKAIERITGTSLQ